MNTEVYGKLLEALREDFLLYVSKFDKLQEENPGMEFEEIDAMVVHVPKDELSEEIVKLSEEYPEEYTQAADVVYLEAVFDALLSEV